MNDAQKESTAQARQAFAAFVRQKGWQDPSPACPRLEREAARQLLGRGFEAYRLGHMAEARECVCAAIAVVREGERWDERSAVA